MKTKIIALILIIILAAGVFYFRLDLAGWYYNLTQKMTEIEKISVDSLINNIQKQISTPPPLRASKEVPEASLTRAGVIKWTNIQRANYGLPPLTENIKLNSAALNKAQDMLKNQYFEHVSPAGVGAEDLAEQAGYEYIALGENLALGNYKNDQALVQAWMDSSGHRANILNSRYSEIGVAVVRGVFEERTTWLAVQEFGLPLSACPGPNSALKSKIESYKSQADKLIQVIEVEQEQIVGTGRFSSRAEYNEAVREYNNLVRQYNNLIAQVKTLIIEFNTQVKIFNECIRNK